MAHIKISKGLDIPITGKPIGEPLLFPFIEHSSLSSPHFIGLNVSSFDYLKFKLLVREGDEVKLGQPILEDKACPARYFVSPAGGVIREIRRGLKRRLLDIVIEVSPKEEIHQYELIDLRKISRFELMTFLKTTGMFAHIYQRPFNFLADPDKVPRSIFVRAIESAPFTPPAEMQVAGYENEFQEGLNVLAKLTEGSVHLVYRKTTTCSCFLDAKHVQKHTAEGPYPISNVSLHIERLDPIRSVEDVVWTLDAHAVVAIGYLVLHGHYFVPRVVSIAGPGVIEERTGYFKIREGFPISKLVEGRIRKGPIRILSGNPLTGQQVSAEDFLGYEDTVLSFIPENTKRKFLHFFRIGSGDYTYSRAYLTGHLDNSDREYVFTTNQHGEERPFIDSTLYDEVMPLNIPTMPLLKAILSEDYDLAVQLGLLEIDSEDFALTSFVCPSKIEMQSIVEKGLRRYADEILK